MEHASIAAFARFALQLLALGAPASLVTETQQAIADETEHAHLCFSLAGAYAGCDLGPGKLDMIGALEASDLELEGVLGSAVREGMIGETLAAVEARHAYSVARDPIVRRALDRIAADETRHAALAWKFAAWAIQSFGDRAREIVLRETTAAIAAMQTETRNHPIATNSEESLAFHGTLDESTRAELHFDAARRAILPGLRALLCPRSESLHDKTFV